MDVKILKADAAATPSDVLVSALLDGKIQKGSALEKLNKAADGEFAKLLENESFKGSAGQAKILYVKGQASSTYLLIVGLGEKKAFNEDVLRKAGAAIVAAAKSVKAESVVIDADSLLSVAPAEQVAEAFFEGVLLGSYTFTRYKKSDDKKPLKKILYTHGQVAAVAKAQKGYDFAHLISSATNMARDLVNTPGGDMTPEALAKQALSLKGVKVKVHDLAAIKKLKMGSYLSVGLGSTENPPKFIEMHYTPKGKPKKKIAIIGKGVTFDTGGYSIKPAKSMENMKDDMAGAAAVIAVMSMLAKLQPKVAVSGYVAATENMVDGFAQRPGDICTAMDGTTIEVLNTDAEGRLTLADAILYARQGKPDLIIDIATLTGACLVSLGLLYSGIMGNDQALIDKLISTGKSCGENMWHLPLPEEYKDEVKSPIADLKNVGSSPYGGTLTAGLFLQHFVGDVKWAHIDIAGPSYTERPLSYTPRGGTGVMVRTLTRFILNS